MILRPRHWYLVGLGAIALGGVWWGWRMVEDLPETRLVNARTIDVGVLGSGRTMSLILQRLGALHPVPASVDRRGRAVFERSGGWAGQQLLSLDPVTEGELVTVLGIEPHWLRRPVSVVALLVEPGELAQLRRHPDRRGRSAERIGFFVYIAAGEVQMASYVGVRLHGGWTRSQPEMASYRVYFRKRYGLDRLAPSPFPSRRDSPPRQVVVRRDGNRTPRGDFRQFTTSLAYDIARRLGVPAPETHPVVFYLNGRPKGVWSLSEWIQKDYLSAHFGYEDFILVRAKAGPRGARDSLKEGSLETFRTFQQWVHQAHSMTVAEVEARVELDNLLGWFLASAFCGTEDALQGSLIRDQGSPEGRWRWIAWDMDQSFGYPQSPGNWRHNNLSHLLRSSDLRSTILRGLDRGDEEFRRRLFEAASEALNHRLDDAFLMSLLEVYREHRELYRIEELDLSPIDTWLRRRGPELRRQLATRFGAELHRVVVAAPPGMELVVDGHLHPAPYEGWYFDGQEIAVGTSTGGESIWRVEGVGRRATQLRLPVEELGRVEWLGWWVG